MAQSYFVVMEHINGVTLEDPKGGIATLAIYKTVLSDAGR